MKATIQEAKDRLNQIEEYWDLQEERGPNDIRRELIHREIIKMDAILVEIRRRNQEY